MAWERLFTWWCKRFTIPLVTGWRAVVRIRSQHTNLHSLNKSVSSNRGPWSVLTDFGGPNWATRFAGKRLRRSPCGCRPTRWLHTIGWSDLHRWGGNGALVMGKGDRPGRYAHCGSVHRGNPRCQYVIWSGMSCSPSSTREHLFAGHSKQPVQWRSELRRWLLDGLGRLECRWSFYGG